MLLLYTFDFRKCIILSINLYKIIFQAQNIGFECIFSPLLWELRKYSHKLCWLIRLAENDTPTSLYIHTLLMYTIGIDRQIHVHWRKYKNDRRRCCCSSRLIYRTQFFVITIRAFDSTFELWLWPHVSINKDNLCMEKNVCV